MTSHSTRQCRAWASKSASRATSSTNSSNRTSTLRMLPEPLSRRAIVVRFPIRSFMRSDSRLIRSRTPCASAPARCRASSSATLSRARGERNSCEISFSSRLCAPTNFSICSAIWSKSRINCETSSCPRESPCPARAERSPDASLRVAFLRRVIGDVKNRASR